MIKFRLVDQLYWLSCPRRVYTEANIIIIIHPSRQNIKKNTSLLDKMVKFDMKCERVHGKNHSL